ncbi:MAG TPA: DUF4249 family protein [Saprospiraceae bacterium]|nr:DUF4249 family protein [Saprospiraceae bacterium]HPI06281.1 DUF4249 family protein [Saprospiraceae bacterium]
MKKILILPLFLLFLSACEKTALTTASDSVNRPVVEAYLSPGQVPAVKVTHQLAFASTDTLARPVEGLEVFIETDGAEHPLAYSAVDSVYHADGTWQVEAGKTYRLHFQYNGGVVEAESVVPEKPQAFTASAGSIAIPDFSPGSGGGMPTFPDPIELGWANTDGAYYLVVVENLETDPVAIYEDNGDTNRPPRPVFRSEPEQTNAYEIGFRNFQYYGTHRVILFKLNAEYASLYDDNGNSSQNLTSPYSNVTNGLGIFTGLNADTLMVEVTQ